MPSMHKKTDTSNIEQKRGKPQLKNRASKRLETINKRQYFDTSKEREHKYEMIETIADLTETLQRYRTYARYFLGIENNEDISNKNGRNNPLFIILSLFLCFHCLQL